jgi:hypothetical protein
LRNRIGICVLHPATECAGKPLTIEHDDGAVEQGAFPKEIAPHQPFKEIRGLSYEVHAGIRAEVRFEGEIFEMEDQRNWSDASFKTYCTPLRIPIPQQVKPGDKVHHVCTVTLGGAVKPVLPVVRGGLSKSRLRRHRCSPCRRLVLRSARRRVADSARG